MIDEAKETPTPGAPGTNRRPPTAFLEILQRRLESKGLNWDALPKQTSIDNPPACFLFRAKGDHKQALAEWHAWLSQAAETDDIPYRFDQPGDANFCIDCTPEFRGRALRAGACSFKNVQFESRVYLGERETIGVSRSPEEPPADEYLVDSMVMPFSALPKEIKDYLRTNAELKGLPEPK